MKLLDNSSISLFILEIPEDDFLMELNKVNESLNITNHVKNEFKQSGYLEKLDKYLSNEIINLKNIDCSSLKKRYPFLGDGELSIIQWGLNIKEDNSYYCILDDLHARKVAEKLNLSLCGSIGLIILLKNKNDYSSEKIEEIINSILNSRFNISKNILNKLRE